MQNLKKTIGIIALILLLVTQGVIFALTAQPAEDSSALSNSVEAAITAPSSDDATTPTDIAAPQEDDNETSGTATETNNPSPVQELITWALGKADV